MRIIITVALNQTTKTMNKSITEAKQFIRRNADSMTEYDIAIELKTRVDIVRQLAKEISVKLKRKPRGPYKMNEPEIKIPDRSFPLSKKKQQRPPAIYTNLPSPFGLADKLRGVKLATDRIIDPDPDRRCRICGCHDYDACIHPEHGNCYWIEEDLCSHCFYWPGESKRYSEL